jgi:hypothetical protein
MEESNANEKEHAMGFHIGTITLQGIFKRIHRQILGQVRDLNYLTWIFSLALVEHKHFDQLHPPTLSHVAPPTRSTMFMQGRNDVITWDKWYILNNCGIKDAKGDFWFVEQKHCDAGMP